MGRAVLKFVAPPAGQQAPLVELVLPQVGCERRDGLWDYFTEDQLPPAEELTLRFETVYTGRALTLADSEADEKRLTAILNAATKGRFKSTEQVTGFPPFEKATVRTEVNWRFDALLARAVGKICLNYMAHTVGVGIALRREFDRIRGSVRYGEGTPPDFIQFRGAPTFRGVGGSARKPRGHLLAVSWDVNNQQLLGMFSPFVEQLTYVVRFTEDIQGVWHELGTGHFYDLSDMRVHKMSYSS